MMARKLHTRVPLMNTVWFTDKQSGDVSDVCFNTVYQHDTHVHVHVHVACNIGHGRHWINAKLG